MNYLCFMSLIKAKPDVLAWFYRIKEEHHFKNNYQAYLWIFCTKTLHSIQIILDYDFFIKHDITLIKLLKKYLGDNYKKFIYNFQYQRQSTIDKLISNEYICFYNIIDQAFNWDRTLEGFEFWANLHVSFKKYLLIEIKKLNCVEEECNSIF